MSFRYYLYISDTKVDMLLSQIDPGYRRAGTAEFSLKLPFVGAKRNVESPAADQVGRLERVTRYLDEHGDVGSVDEPGQFFRGLLPMQWGLLPTDGGQVMVYFGGRTENTIVGLGGSSFHVLGGGPPAAQPPPHVFGGMSNMPSLLSGLVDAVDADEADRTPLTAGASLDAADTQALASVHRAGGRLRGPAQNVEFLAKRLLSGPSPYPELDGRPGMTVLLGSPLYVALVD
ncbi:SAVMC3_10250 family protein [Micromonospora sp. WMMD1120]|uniref:DUF7019 family protein n=1 Tax=Micromonospora sp. WMMD1120 TaxID=3016106 RepID=UPI002415A72B|nr:SAVMC3_10250 family protein [Micromonospora sp. WMMD1120]MDG4805586.1 SAVMC3_10250 family protein [Micromonospora sp. WMMD1120]